MPLAQVSLWLLELQAAAAVGALLRCQTERACGGVRSRPKAPARSPRGSAEAACGLRYTQRVFVRKRYGFQTA